MPFVTEEIWHHLYQEKNLCAASWPEVKTRFINAGIEADMQKIINVITAIRNIRSEWNIKKGQRIHCYFTAPDKKDFVLLNSTLAIIQNLAQLEQTKIKRASQPVKNAAAAIIENIKCAIPLGEIIDLEKEKKRISGQIEEQRKMIDGISQRLNNRDFLSKAPKDVVENDKNRLGLLQKRMNELEKAISNFE